MKPIIIVILALVIILIGLVSYGYAFNPIEGVIELKSEFDDYNYIQASHNKVTYYTNDGLKIPSIDYCAKLTGSSMQPTTFTGNTLCFKKYDMSMKNMLKEGMIIEFIYGEDEKKAHRIKALYKDSLLTQGDNSDHPETVDYEDINGIGVAIILT